MTERDDIREAFSKIVIEADRDWNGNVRSYRKHLVDRLTDSGLFHLATAGEEVTDPTLYLKRSDVRAIIVEHGNFVALSQVDRLAPLTVSTILSKQGAQRP